MESTTPIRRAIMNAKNDPSHVLLALTALYIVLEAEPIRRWKLLVRQLLVAHMVAARKREIHDGVAGVLHHEWVFVALPVGRSVQPAFNVSDTPPPSRHPTPSQILEFAAAPGVAPLQSLTRNDGASSPRLPVTAGNAEQYACGGLRNGDNLKRFDLVRLPICHLVRASSNFSFTLTFSVHNNNNSLTAAWRSRSSAVCRLHYTRACLTAACRSHTYARAQTQAHSGLQMTVDSGVPLFVFFVNGLPWFL